MSIIEPSNNDIDNSNSNHTIKDALKIARLLRKHLASTEDCPHCRELFGEAFD